MSIVYPAKNAMTTILLSILPLAVISLAQANETIRFDSPESTARATKLLHEIGLRPFMDKVWNQQVAAPGINSKYWVDQIARDNPGQASLERAYRDFGYEVSVQVEDMAFEIYENPDKNHERERLDWLLRFSKWLMKPGKFENFRIGMRIEDAATMPLHRVIFDFSISNDDIDGYFARFTTFKESALIRAGILYEESNGVLDVRDLAQKAEENKDDGFEYRWISLARKAYRYFGSRMPEYTLDPEIIEKVGIQYSFFCRRH